MCLDAVDPLKACGTPDIRNKVVAEVWGENQAKNVKEHIPSPYFSSQLNMFTIVHDLECICYCVTSIKCK